MNVEVLLFNLLGLPEKSVSLKTLLNYQRML